MSEEPICGKCGLPIHQSETGLRYFGHYIAHDENRCLELLRSQLLAVRGELETERLRLAACGAAALGYFEDCKPEYRSASLEDVLRLYASLQQAQGEVAAVNAALGLYQAAMDRIYNHNEAARAAVVQHFGTLHLHPTPSDKQEAGGGV